MAIYGLTTFEDILNAVLEELKIPDSDSTEVNRLKRDINMCYVNQVAPAKRWTWLTGFVSKNIPVTYADGTVSVTPGSQTITFSTAPAASKAGFLFAVDQFSEIYTISAHTAGSTTATISAPYNGALGSGLSFKIWTDVVGLPTDCRETIEVYHDYHGEPMKPLGLQDMRRKIAASPRFDGRPAYYSTYDYFDPSTSDAETESDRYRLMRIYPSVSTLPTTLHIDYIKEVTPLELDDDEPLMPIEDRIVLVYGALARAWKRHADPQSAAESLRDYENKLAQMMGRVEDSQDKPQFTPDSAYLSKKRGRGQRIRGASTYGAGGYSAPTYIAGATINGANVTGNITVSSGITIDGRDISADGALLDAHIADTDDAHDASAISFSPTGTVAATNVQNAIAEVAAEAAALGTLTDSYIFVGNAANVAIGVAVTGDISVTNTGVTSISSEVVVNGDVSPTAGIAHSKMAALTASRAMVTDGSGFATTANATAAEVNWLVNTEALQQLALNDNQASAATIDSWAHASFDSFIIKYSLKRGTANKETGMLMIATDGTSASIAQSASSLGTLGVTFSVDVSGTDVRLRYTSTSTGVAPTISWKIEKWLA